MGLTYAARRKGENAAALVLMGDGATSEGDAHEAYNFAAVWNTPVVFLVQNNHWAISVPVREQSVAPTLAHKAIGYGMPGYHVDGNDVAAVHAVVTHALTEARSGSGPAIIEADTYRMDPHTNSDDPGRYRDNTEVERWQSHDPLLRLETVLRTEGEVDDTEMERIDAEAERVAARMREHLAAEERLSARELFAHVYGSTPILLAQQRRELLEETHEG